MLAVFLMTSVVIAIEYSQMDGMEVPKEVRSLVGNQRVNVFLDGEFLFAGEVKDGKIYSNSTLLDKSSLDIYLTNETLNKITNSEDKMGAVLETYKSGETKVVKKTFLNKIKFFFARFFI